MCPPLPSTYLRLGGGTLGPPACSERGSGACNILGLTSCPAPCHPHLTPGASPDWGREGHTDGAGRTRVTLGPHLPCKTLTQLDSSITSSVLGPQGSGGAQGALPLPGLPGPPCSGSPPSVCPPVLPICLPVCTSVLLTVTPCPQTSGGRFQPGLLPASVSGGAYWGGCVLGDHRQSSLHSHSPPFWLVCPCEGSGGLGPGLSLSTGWHPAGTRGICRSPWGN